MAGKRDTSHWIEAKCPICGKIFFPTPVHAYKDKRVPYARVCSWTCVLISERMKDAEAQKRKIKEERE